jgi:signal transduction histidine kinase
MQRLLHQPTAARFSTLRARLVLLVLVTVLPGFALVLFGGESRSTLDNVIELVLVGGLVVAAATLGAEIFVLRRLKSLVEATRRLAAGDLTARSGLPYGPDELGQLGRSFDEMATALELRQARAERAEDELHASLQTLRRTDAERRRLLAYLAQAQEKERERIAADIHDDSIQSITAVGMRLELLRRRVTEPVVLEAMVELERTVLASIARLRHLLFELRPPVLDRDGLAPALRMYLEEASRDGGISFSLSNGFDSEPAPETRTILYRIAIEALTNVRKHAHARSIDVDLQELDWGYLVRIHDDGAGFLLDPTSAPMPGHLGLTAMRERAELAGGWWRATSAPGAGTTVEFWLPASEPSTASFEATPSSTAAGATVSQAMQA